MTRDDDAAARFTALYEAYYSLILTTCTRRLGDRPAGEDAAQEVFRIAWQGFERENPNLPWLYAIARNVVGNVYRHRSRLETRERIDQLATEHQDDDAIEIRRAMMQLKNSDRELLFMAYWEGLAGREIARILQVPEAAARTRLKRARNALRHVLQDALSRPEAPHG